jgi:5-formyltetrahydrofolate cyclo-ligase
MMDKNIIRKQAMARRKSLTPIQQDEMSLGIANQLLRCDIWQGTYYHLFLTITQKGEVDTHPILDILHGRDKKIVVSKANFQQGSLSHFILDENTRLITSKYGIPEPEGGQEVFPDMLDVVFVPLLTYDQKGMRLGYGKGFYDRFLAQCSKNCKKVGLSFFGPESELIPCETWDIALDLVVTPDAVHRF